MDNIDLLAQVLQCLVRVLLTTYLGLPLGAVSKDLGVWNSEFGYSEGREEVWQKRYFSKGGEEVLSMSIYRVFLHIACPWSSLLPSTIVIGKLEKVAKEFSLGCGGWSKEVSLSSIADHDFS